MNYQEWVWYSRYSAGAGSSKPVSMTIFAYWHPELVSRFVHHAGIYENYEAYQLIQLGVPPYRRPILEVHRGYAQTHLPLTLGHVAP